MPSSIAPMITSKSEYSPRLWPSVLGRPRCLAQRPLPSITRATCRGTRSAGMAGGRAPPGCGSGGRTGCAHAAPAAPPAGHRPDDSAGSSPTLTRAPRAAASGWSAPGATAGRRPPGRCTLPGAAAADASASGQSPRSSALIRATVCTDGRRGPGGRQDRQVRPPAATGRTRARPPVAPTLPVPPHTRALLQRGRVSGDRERAQQERVEHQARVVLPLPQRAQPADQQQELPQRGLALLAG